MKSLLRIINNNLLNLFLVSISQRKPQSPINMCYYSRNNKDNQLK